VNRVIRRPVSAEDCPDRRGPVTLYAFGIPDEECEDQFHIMVVIEEATNRHLPDAMPVAESVRNACW
jgi:hypothetical protein